MPLVLDIETVPLAATVDAPYPTDRKPPANYKTPETIAKWEVSDRQKWADERAKECSLNPRLGRVLCIGVMATDTEMDRPHILYAATEEDEAETLKAFWDLVYDHHAQVVTWNGNWDLRFLVIRSMALGVTPTIGAYQIGNWFRKYRVSPHFDCKAVLLNWDVRIAGEGLNEWATFLGVPGKSDGISGKDVYPLYLGGMHDEIAEYCANDVLATYHVYQKMAAYYVDEPGVVMYSEES